MKVIILASVSYDRIITGGLINCFYDLSYWTAVVGDTGTLMTVTLQVFGIVCYQQGKQ